MSPALRLEASPSARARGRALSWRFGATGATGAEETLARVLPPLEAYVAGWRLRMLESCRATHVNHTQSLELARRRAACLASRRVHAAGVLETFASADCRIVANAVSVVDGLPALEACDRGDVLLARPPPPAGQGDVVAAIETMLVKGRDLRQRGRFVDALHIFESAASDARKLAWAPLAAETLAEVAQMRAQLFMDSKQAVEELAAEAAKAKDDERTLIALKRTRVVRTPYVGISSELGRIEPGADTSTMLRVRC